MTRDKRAIAHLEKIARTEATDKSMPIPRSNICAAGKNFVAVRGFLDFDPASTIKTLRKSRRESLGHMLDCHNSRAVAWHLFENLKECFGTPGGRTDGDDSIPVLRGQRGDGRRNHNISIVIARTFLAEPPKLCYTRRRSRSHCIFEQNSGLFQKPATADLRLRKDIDCTNFHAANRGFGSGAG